MWNSRQLAAARAYRTRSFPTALLCALLAIANAAVGYAGAAPVSLRWELQSAAASTSVPKDSVPAEFTLTNTGTQPLAGKRWAIYFNCMMDVGLGAAFSQLVLERVTGYLYRLRPGDGYADLRPGQSLHIPLVHPDTLVNAALAPEGPYLVFDNAPEEGLAILDFQRAPFPADHATSPEQIYARNAGVVPLAESQLPPVFPTPREYERRAGTVQWTVRPQVVGAPELRAEVAAADAMLQPYFSGGSATAGAPTVRLSVAVIAGLKEPEGYELTIDPKAGVTLIGVSAAGVSRGLASLRQLLPVPGPAVGGVVLPALTIRDAPRFAYTD